MEIKHLQIQETKINNITQRTIVHIGGKGTGKTTLLKEAISSLPRDMPGIVFDPLNVINTGYRKYIVNKKSLSFGSITAKIVNQDIAKNRIIIIGFDRLITTEIVPFVDAFIPEIKMKNGMWFFDEIHEFVPQIGEYSHETERMIRHTRNDNNGVWMTTQRPANASKKVIALTDFLILFRVVWPNDLEVVDKLVSKTNMREEILNSVSNLSFLEGYTLDYDPLSGKYNQ